MNKYVDFINTLKKNNYLQPQKIEEIIAIAEELVSYRTPMKIINYRSCPRCNSNVNNEVFYDKHYCSNCGQKLDWEVHIDD